MSRRVAAITAAFVSLVAMGAREARADERASAGMNSPGMLGIGAFLSSAGTAGLAVGGYLFSSGQSGCEGLSRDQVQVPSQTQIDACTSSVTEQVAGIVTMVTGGAFFIAGVPLMIAGGVPADSPSSSNQARLMLQLGAGAAGLRLDY